MISWLQRNTMSKMMRFSVPKRFNVLHAQKI
jgi:hypothetical protein